MSNLQQVRQQAETLIARHLGDEWSFSFDNAKRRAGFCNYTRHRISLSRYLAARFDDDANQQTLLHEIAHALAGHTAGHGPAWKRIAHQLGYRGGRTAPDPGVTELAPWVGVCPAGHTTYRHRRPTKVTSCGQCARHFDERFTITWSWRAITPGDHRAEPTDRSGAHRI
ncbi:MAG: SprT-like domain-containing protein [Propioniciclava sp.]